MATKFKVTANDQFLGHYHSTTPLGAIERAIAENYEYHPEIIGEKDCKFVVDRGNVRFAAGWDMLQELATKYKAGE